MKQTYRIKRSLAALAIALSLSLAVPAAVFARAGSDTSVAPSGSTETGETIRSDGQRPAEDRQGTLESKRQQLEGRQAAANEKRADKLEVANSKRQKRCESRKHGLTTKSENIVRNGQRMQARITDILDKAVSYQQASHVAVENFDSLVATADSAKTASANNLVHLQAVKPTIDCNRTSVAADVAAFKAAAQTTRDGLKAYKTAVKAVLQALETATETGTAGGAR